MATKHTLKTRARQFLFALSGVTLLAAFVTFALVPTSPATARTLTAGELVTAYGDTDPCTTSCKKQWLCKNVFYAGGVCLYCDSTNKKLYKCCPMGKIGQECSNVAGPQCLGTPRRVAAEHTPGGSCNGCLGSGFMKDGNCTQNGPYGSTPTGDTCNCGPDV